MTAAALSADLREALHHSFDGNYLAGRSAVVNRDARAASLYWRAALRQDPRNVDVLQRAFIATVTDGNMVEAVPLAERVYAVDKGNIVARLTLGAQAIRNGNMASAKQYLGRGQRANDDFTLGLLLGWVAFGSGDVKGAVAHFDRLRGPDFYTLFKNYQAGLVLDLAGRKDEAGQRLASAYKQDNAILRVVDAYGRWSSRNAGINEAKEVYAAFGKVNPDHPVIVAALAQLNEGKTLPPLIASAQDGAAEVLYSIGALLSRQGAEDVAIVYLQLAQFLAPNSDFILTGLGDLYELMKKPELAVEVYDRVPANSLLKRNAEIQMALNLDALGRTDEAKKHLRDLIAKNPKDRDAYQALGNILRVRNQHAEAAEAYGQAIALLPKIEPQHWLLFYFRGTSYERAKMWPKAEPDLKKALELVPPAYKAGQAMVLNYLGYSWIDQGLHLEEGLDLVKKAVELRPDDGSIVDSLGWAYYRLGRYDEAVSELERAVELRSDEAVINDHLGDAYWRVGRKLEATFQWNHARDLKPEPDDLAKILDKLKNGLTDSNSDKPVVPVKDAQGTAPASEGEKKAN